MTRAVVQRWELIVACVVVQMIAGSVYSMGAWQDELRDSLGVSMGIISAIGAATFAGSVFAMLGGCVFDRVGPRVTVLIGSALLTLGYTLLCLAVVASQSLDVLSKSLLAALGSMMAGYSSVSLLDNIVCMACSLSFPGDRAKVVGYLKAVLATAAGLWALLWVHVFKRPNGPGLVLYLAFVAAMSLTSVMCSLVGLTIIPQGSGRQSFTTFDSRRLNILICFLVMLSLFNVVVSFLFSRGFVKEIAMLGYVGGGLALLPLLILPFSRSRTVVAEDGETLKENIAALAPEGLLIEEGLTFGVAVCGLDFWLLWIMQFGIFGSGVATNQNLGLILESAGSPSASGLGVALFALASSFSRVVVGILSDQYGNRVSRFDWLTIIAACAVIGQLFLSSMNLFGIMSGIVLMGLSFGAFFTVIVPVVNEMYGRRQFGVIMGSQLASQAAAAFAFSLTLLPIVYRLAANGSSKCEGAMCFRPSFLLLAVLLAFIFLASILLKCRNKHSLPITRLISARLAGSQSSVELLK